MRLLLVLLAAAALAAGTYFGLERLGPKGRLPALLRFVAWAALGILLVNVSCPAPPERRAPLVLLDASLSMAAGGRWAEARRLADSLGEVRFTGDEGAAPGDTLPDRGRSRVAAALVAAAAGERPVWLVTDGEVEDRAEVPADLLARAGIRVLARPASDDVALALVEGPSRLTIGDSLRVEVTVRASGARAADTVALELRFPGRREPLARRAVPLQGGEARVILRADTRGLPAGEHLLEFARAGAADAIPDTDVRLHRLALAATPGAVLVAAPGDWDARFLFAAIREVAELPLRGYVRVAPGEWRLMSDLSRVGEPAVREAARGADLLVLKGDVAAFGAGTRARGVWRWPSGEGGAPAEPADWYLTPTIESPLAGALAGLPLDSFPPATQLGALQPQAGDWVAFTAQAGRRGAPRAAMLGGLRGRAREVTTAADGLYRWRFRGGSAEQGYRALVAATVSWLLEAPDSAAGRTRPLRHVAQRGRPVTFQWIAPGAPAPLAITASSDSVTRTDTLRFDGAGQAQLRLPPGRWRYRTPDGTAGVLGVERYSDEYLPRPVALEDQPPQEILGTRRTGARDALWLFALAVAALCGEWLVRRRMGLR